MDDVLLILWSHSIQPTNGPWNQT